MDMEEGLCCRMRDGSVWVGMKSTHDTLRPKLSFLGINSHVLTPKQS